MNDSDHGGMSRRTFLRTATVAAAAAGAFGLTRRGDAQDERPLRAGLVGCGGRGTGAAHDFLNSSKNVTIVGLADAFQNRLDGARQSLKDDKGIDIADDHCFVGYDAYEKLIGHEDVDIVLLATPPFFRPAHFACAVDAGKHVFMEKPMAVDPVGCREVMDAAARADQKGLSVVVGTQRRHQKGYLECLQHVRDGAIGDIIGARAYWVGSPLGGWDRTDHPTDLDEQVRSWFHWTWLSGDHIVEQHVHNIDVCNWFVGKHPVRALGFGFRARKTYGNQYDFFAVDYEYDNGVHMDSLCRQIAGCDQNVSDWVIGTKGVANCGGHIMDHSGKTIWQFQGDQPNPYVQEHADLVDSIRNGTPINEGKEVIESVMTAVMGRMSAYTGKAVTWDQAMESNMRLGPEECVSGATYVADPLPVPGE
ncbi:MAG TPA: Gfo/Idh/MocA family oxidoreductase [Armatimonadota bacterium]|nr:Gfo/Idh/MocA family oxidoreductase [Armatimonadota bacterium]